ncbi:hypothetical protein L9F63_011834, partial [Diploptera punctata]
SKCSHMHVKTGHNIKNLNNGMLIPSELVSRNRYRSTPPICSLREIKGQPQLHSFSLVTCDYKKKRKKFYHLDKSVNTDTVDSVAQKYILTCPNCYHSIRCVSRCPNLTYVTPPTYRIVNLTDSYVEFIPKVINLERIFVDPFLTSFTFLNTLTAGNVFFFNIKQYKFKSNFRKSSKFKQKSKLSTYLNVIRFACHNIVLLVVIGSVLFVLVGSVLDSYAG